MQRIVIGSLSAYYMPGTHSAHVPMFETFLTGSITREGSVANCGEWRVLPVGDGRSFSGRFALKPLADQCHGLSEYAGTNAGGPLDDARLAADVAREVE